MKLIFFSQPDSIDIISTEQVYASLLTPEDHYCELTPHTKPASKPVSTFVRGSGKSRNNSMRSSGSHKVVNGCVALTGTIRRGKHKPEKTVDIQVYIRPCF